MVHHPEWKRTDIGKFPYCFSNFAELEFILRAPTDYRSEALAPLLVFLHGVGESKSKSVFDIKLVLKHGPWYNPAADRFCILAPQCPHEFIWSTLCQPITALIYHIQRHFPVDRNRCYLTGLSMGAFGIWSLAVHRPNLFAALIPICGGFTKGNLPKSTSIHALKKCQLD